jgi:hypothetical protein
VHFLKIRVSQGHDDGHSCFKLLNQEFQFLLDLIWLDSALNPFADLSVLLSLFSNGWGIDLSELRALPLFGHCLPFFKRVPHQVTILQLCAQNI